VEATPEAHRREKNMSNDRVKRATVGYPCECGETFETAEDFSNHFDRSDPKLICKLSPAAAKKLRNTA